MKRVLITGAAGFIGSHLGKHLAARGDTVVGCDNFNDYYDVNLKRARAHTLDIIECDIQNKGAISQIVRERHITHIVHLAAQPGVRHSLTHPQAYVDTNLNGFVQILEVCKQFPDIPFIYASSSSVYGLNEQHPFAEHHSTDRPTNLYGASKKSGELLAHSYHHLYGIPVTGLRFFTVYGPWGRPDMAYFKFANAIMHRETIPVFNRGEMSRDFTYIDDIVEGIAAAIDLGATCEIFNLGNNKPESLMQLIQYLEDSLGQKAKLDLLPMQPGEVKRTWADISKSQKKLGFSPKTSLKEGINQFVEWYQRFYCEKHTMLQS